MGGKGGPLDPLVRSATESNALDSHTKTITLLFYLTDTLQSWIDLVGSQGEN